MKQCVYVELDALLDTRIAVIASIDQDAAVKCLKSKDYFEREIDDFQALTGITKEVFREAYAKRDVTTLRNSRMTMVPQMLDELISKMEEMEAETPFVEELSVEVNAWPYVLTAEEEEMFMLAVSAFAGIETKVKFVNLPPQALTPDYIRSKYSGLIFYNFRDWCVTQNEALAKRGFPGTTVLAPALFYEEIPKVEDYKFEGMREDVSPFAIAELAFYECFQLQLLTPKIFSIAVP